MKDKIFVTQPFLPPLEEYINLLKDIWDSKQLTNHGPFHEQLELELASYLQVPFVSLLTNGTTALLCALKCLDISGDVITTPYTFAGTVHALKWMNINPVFVDIESKYCNIDPSKIEAAITPNTTAILAVHIYGNPCDTEKIEAIGKKHNLKVIYDAAHAFGIKQNQTSILNKGDLSAISFHATKIYHCFEGGAIISHDEKTKESIDKLRNFGFKDETSFEGYGINAKMNEIQASMGVLQLKYIDQNIEKHKAIYTAYVKHLNEVSGISFIQPSTTVEYNYSYFPIYIDESYYGHTRNELYEHLKRAGVHTRKYFYPLISDLDIYSDTPGNARANFPIADTKSRQVLCLPMYSNLETKEVRTICSLITKSKWN